MACAGEEKKTYQVLLQTDSLRYLPFLVELSQVKLVLAQKVPESSSKVHIEHYFNDLHVRTCDTSS